MQVLIQVPQMGLDPKIACSDQGTAQRILPWVGVTLEFVFKKSAKGFKNASVKILIIMFLEQFQQGWHAKAKGYGLACLPEQIGGQAVKHIIIG